MKIKIVLLVALAISTFGNLRFSRINQELRTDIAKLLQANSDIEEADAKLKASDAELKASMDNLQDIAAHATTAVRMMNTFCHGTFFDVGSEEFRCTANGGSAYPCVNPSRTAEATH